MMGLTLAASLYAGLFGAAAIGKALDLEITVVAGSANFDIRSGKRAKVKLKLHGKRSRSLHLGRSFAARAIAETHDGSGATVTSERTVRLRR